MREAVSAELDGEVTGISTELASHHLTKCEPCRSWATSIAGIHRSLRVTTATEVPDLTAAILAAIGNATPTPALTSNRITVTTSATAAATKIKACRLILACCALMQLMATVPVLLGTPNSPIHLDHELGSWDIALAVGLLVAALRPARAWGMLPLVGAVVTTLTFTGLIDVASGHTTFTGESSHVLELIGLFFLWALTHFDRQANQPSQASLIRETLA